jgi:hypothetical protein
MALGEQPMWSRPIGSGVVLQAGKKTEDSGPQGTPVLSQACSRRLAAVPGLAPPFTAKVEPI